MSDQPTAKKSNARFIIGVVAALLILGGAYFFAIIPAEHWDAAKENAAVTEEIAVVDEAAPTEEVVASETSETEAVVEPEATSTEAAPATDAAGVPIPQDTTGFDMAEIQADRVLGNPSAPIKIAEFASLTCSHCAHFHNDMLAGVKAALIDSGKAYLVFSDFPLNAPALHASMAARCVDKDKYFDFIGVLFKTQEEWAFDANYLSLLKAKAAEFGLDEERFQTCINSKQIQEAVVGRMRAAQDMWKIQSTPSFVINNKTTISGGLPAEEFVAKVNEAANPTAAPEATPDTQAAP